MEKAKIGNFCISRFSLVGYPDDLGVKNVNGRTGAAQGPSRFSHFFKRLNGDRPVQEGLVREELSRVGFDLEENLFSGAEVTERLFRELSWKKGESLIAIGGGHDCGYAWILGISKALEKKIRIGCVNLDAHLDLRPYDPVMTSGSPFRRVIEEGLLRPADLIEFGIQDHCNGEALFEFARGMRIPVIPFSRLRNGRAVAEFKKALASLEKRVDVILISVDLDALSFAFAPGVSAPQGEGFTGSELYQMLEHAGSRKKVASLGIFELAPPLDVQDFTARIAAQGAWKFLRSKMSTKNGATR